MKKIVSYFLCFVMLVTMFSVASISVSAASFTINGHSVNKDSVKWPGKGQCWAYCQSLYKIIWNGKTFTSTRATGDDMLRNRSMADCTLTVDHIKAYVSKAALGSVIRVCVSGEWNTTKDSNGHSQIIVAKDANGFKVLESWSSGTKENYYTWSKYCQHGFSSYAVSHIKYIKWPSAPAYASSTPAKPATAPAAPKMTGISNAATGVQVTWTGVSNATSYRIYRKTSGTGWAALGDVGASARSYVDKTAKSGTTYQYTVRSINQSTLGGYSSTGLSLYYLATTKITSIANGPVNIVLKWNKVSGATGYYVYRKVSGGSWTRIATTKNLTYSDGKRSQGVQYFYTIRAYYGNNASACATTASICRLQQPVIKKQKLNGKVIYGTTGEGTVLSLTAKQPYVSGYQMYYKREYYVPYEGNTSESIISTTYIVNGKQKVCSPYSDYFYTEDALIGGTDGLTFFNGVYGDVRVRTFRTINGKNSYSCWSPVINNMSWIQISYGTK